MSTLTDEQLGALLSFMNWSQSWAREASDLEVGDAIAFHLRLFLLNLAKSSLTYKTLTQHKGNLFTIGGLVFDSMTQFPESAQSSVAESLNSILELWRAGSPLLKNPTGAEQRSFNTTCNKLYKYQSL